MAGDKRAIIGAAQRVDSFDDCGHAVGLSFFHDPARFEVEQLPAVGLQIVVALVVLDSLFGRMMPAVAVGFDAEFGPGAVDGEIECVAALVHLDPFLPDERQMERLERGPEAVFEWAGVVQVIDLSRRGEFLPVRRDEGQTPPAGAGDGLGQLLQRFQEELVVVAAAFGADGFVGKQFEAGSAADVEDAAEITDGIGFLAEGLGLVEGQPIGRPAGLEVAPDAVHRDAIPLFVIGQMPVVEVVDDGDQNIAALMGHICIIHRRSSGKLLLQNRLLRQPLHNLNRLTVHERVAQLKNNVNIMSPQVVS